MKKYTLKLILLFLIGAFLYPIIEILYRGRSHLSMGILGGCCLCAIFLVHLGIRKRNLLLKALLSAFIITQLEFLTGVLVNILFNLSVWDYTDQPFHVLGQICPLFSFFWFLLSFIPLIAFQLVERKIFSKPIYNI